MRDRILLTGSTGFIGSHLLHCLNDYDVAILGRTAPENTDKNINFFEASINSTNDYSQALDSVKYVIHLAAKNSQNRENDSATDYFEVNTNGTLNLAKQAAKIGVKRFIFLSTIKVNGEGTTPNHPFTRHDEASPTDAYSNSKCKAEQELLELTKESSMEVVIIRPPLVYGPGVKSNFRSLINIVNKQLPLPFKSVNNKRSLVSVENLCDLIMLCLTHTEAANKIFLVSDGKDVSIAELIYIIAEVSAKKERLFSMPVSILLFVAKMLGKSAEVDRLLGSLQVDITDTKRLLGWQPPITMTEQLRKMINA